jgi:hypothetical protein
VYYLLPIKFSSFISYQLAAAHVVLGG